MRRRDRWRNLAWLTWVEGDSPAGAIQPSGRKPMTVASALLTLTRDYGRYVDMELDGAAYRVRVLPRSIGSHVGKTNVGMSYSGVDLGTILTTAVAELELIENTRTLFQHGATERVRWVPCL